MTYSRKVPANHLWIRKTVYKFLKPEMQAMSDSGLN